MTFNAVRQKTGDRISAYSTIVLFGARQSVTSLAPVPSRIFDVLAHTPFTPPHFLGIFSISIAMVYDKMKLQKTLLRVREKANLHQHIWAPKVLRGTVYIFVFMIFVGSLGACSKSSPLEDKPYLAPIPPATLDAYHPIWPIQSELQAVIAARREMFTAQFLPAQEPRVISAEMLTLSEAHQRLDTPWAFYSEERPGTTSVWLIVFDGYWQASSSDIVQTDTSGGMFYGCLSVVLDANEEGYTWVQENECPPCETSVCLTPFPTLSPTQNP